MANRDIEEEGAGLRLSPDEAERVIWLYDHVRQPNVSTAIWFGQMEALIGRLRKAVAR
jgi:hypothetical protein